MTIVVLACICLVAVVVQDVFPGRSWYHTGSYALLLFGACALLVWRLQKRLRVADARVRPLTLVTAGALIGGAAGLASGLLGPDTRTFTSAPGASVALAEPPGTLRFPFDPSPEERAVTVRFETADGRTITLPENRRRYIGGFVMWGAGRQVAVVAAADLQGRRLTITQPSNASFLSPVLLFTQSSRVGGRVLPVDSFAIPAAQRVVKTVLLSATVLAQMRGHPEVVPALLVAVEDERGRLLRGAIRLIPSHTHSAVGGVIIGDSIADYPQVVVAAAPYLPVLILGVAVFGAGLIWFISLKNSFRS